MRLSSTCRTGGTVLPRFRSPHPKHHREPRSRLQGENNGDYIASMDRDVTTLLKEALRLSAPDRVALAEALIASLDEDVYDEAEAAWRSEIERRISELDSGSISPIPWHAARQRLFEHARRRALRRLDVGLDLQWTPPRSRDAVHEREPSQAELMACSPTSDLLTPAGVGPGFASPTC